MSNPESAVPSQAEIKARIASLCKPPGSLGVIEQVAERLCMTQRTLLPRTQPRSVTVFAADHGVTQEGVSAWPSAITRSVVEQMQHSRTASGVFADTLRCHYEVVDVGLLEPLGQYGDGALNCARRRGSGNLRCEAALTEKDFQHAWQVGEERASHAIDAGNHLLLGGEMGIGNTTAATCLIALFCQLQSTAEIDAIVGTGAGADASQMMRKQTAIRDAVGRVRSLGIEEPQQIGRHVGGLEIVALAGYFVGGAVRGATLLIDGVIATSAAVLAAAVQPGVQRQMMAAHRSTEPAQQVALKSLGLEPVLNLQMRLGEATGALAALPLLDLAASMINDMASIDELQA
ncbi:MAG: nicotinate-nucleotide--dimethylbenzimidazole phosphoribosyltransferase [Planctomycetota bacterium]